MNACLVIQKMWSYWHGRSSICFKILCIGTVSKHLAISLCFLWIAVAQSFLCPLISSAGYHRSLPRISWSHRKPIRYPKWTKRKGTHSFLIFPCPCWHLVNSTSLRNKKQQWIGVLGCMHTSRAVRLIAVLQVLKWKCGIQLIVWQFSRIYFIFFKVREHLKQKSSRCRILSQNSRKNPWSLQIPRFYSPCRTKSHHFRKRRSWGLTFEKKQRLPGESLKYAGLWSKSSVGTFKKEQERLWNTRRENWGRVEQYTWMKKEKIPSERSLVWWILTILRLLASASSFSFICKREKSC